MSAKQGHVPTVETTIDIQPTRNELEEKAKSLNIKFDGRTTNAKLILLIDKVLES